MDDLRTKLWEYVYGLLDEADAEAVRHQIISDREVARSYARVKLQSELIAQAARASEKADPWTMVPEELRVRPAARGSRMRQAVVGALSAALSLALLLYASGTYWSKESPVRSVAIAAKQQQLLETYPRLVVTGPTSIPAGRSVEYEVRVETLDNSPLRLPIEGSLESADGRTLWEEAAPTDINGMRHIALPDNLDAGAAFFKVAADKAPDAPEFSTWLRIEPAQKEVIAFDQVAMVDSERALVRTVDLTNYSWKKSRVDGSPLRTQLGAEGETLLAQDLERVHWSLVHRGWFDQQLAQVEAKDDPASPFQRSGVDAPTIRAKDVQRDAKDVVTAAPQQPSLDDDGSKLASTASSTDAKKSVAPGSSSATASETTAATLNQPLPGEDSRPLVEGVYEKGELLKARLVERPESRSKQPDAAATVRYFDFFAAPPKPVDVPGLGSTSPAVNGEVSATEDKTSQPDLLMARVQPLQVELSLDRARYRPLDQVTVDIRVTNEAGEPQPSILGVRVDAVDPQWADLPVESFQPPTFFAVHQQDKVGSASDLPLVFDNAQEQQQRFQSAMDSWLGQKQAERHRASWTLLGGSAAGLGMLIIAGLLRVLPSGKVWIPIALLLGSIFVTGLNWKGTPGVPALALSIQPLMSYGITTQPPDTTRLESRTQWHAKSTSSDNFAELAYARDGVERVELDSLQAFGLSVSNERLQRQSTETKLPEVMHWLAVGNNLDVSKRGESLAEDQLAIAGIHNRALSFGDFQPDRFGAGDSLNRFAGLSPGAASGASRFKTVYWHPSLATDSNGHAEASFDIPEGNESYRVNVVVHTNNCYGSNTLSIPIALPYRVP